MKNLVIHCLSMVLLVLMIKTEAIADLGTVRDSKVIEGYECTLFSAPEPFRAGPVDISVMVVNNKTGQALVDCQIDVSLI